MKCICPMGGERDCPPACTPAHRRAHRKTVAEQMYRDGKTMEQIAKQLDVTHATISNDLKEFVNDLQTQPRTSKRGRKGEGRPKAAPKPHAKQAIIAELDLKGKSQKEIANETGVGERQVRHLAERERIRREAFAELLDAASVKHFEEKGRLRIEDAIRIHKARLDRQFEQCVNEEVRRRIDAADDATRATNKKLSLENINLQRIVGQYAVFTKSQFRQMQMLCHPDSSASEQTKAELSRILVENEKRLVKPEKQQAA